LNGPSPEFTEVLLVQPSDAEGLRLRTALVSAPKVEVINELTDARAAVDAAAQLDPHVVLLRVELSNVIDNRVLGALRDIAPQARILLHAFVAPVAAPGRRRWIGRLIDRVVATRDAPTLEARLELAGDPASVPLARSLLAQLLGQWEMEDFVDLAELLITELVANAIRHVPGACAVELTRCDDALHIAVIDSGAGMPDLQNPGISAFGGRGLHIVAALSDAWGTDRLEDGSKAVWAQLKAPLKEGE
jgi:anti-sigma regulatory factor (Ser/Thr protein kinase)